MIAGFGLVAITLLAIAAWRDVATRTIPNSISLVLVVTGGIARSLEGLSAFVLSAEAALLIFFLLLVVYVRGLVGGGDVKIITALAVGLPLSDCYRFFPSQPHAIIGRPASRSAEYYAAYLRLKLGVSANTHRCPTALPSLLAAH